MLRRIVFPLDSSARSECALRYAAELAREQACPTTLIVTGSALDE